MLFVCQESDQVQKMNKIIYLSAGVLFYIVSLSDGQLFTFGGPVITYTGVGTLGAYLTPGKAIFSI